jgi:DNA-binding beta-propeller fold protein YncE
MNNRYVVLLLGLFPAALPAQTVNAHYAQYLVTATMSAHPELQKMGLHVVAPGAQDETIVACSVPSKIGKKSSANDLEEERSGKPAVKTVIEKSFYDLALPLHDTSQRAIGMIVMEMRFSGASDADDAVRKAQFITTEVERQIPNKDSLFNPAPSAAPLVLMQTTALPDITGDFDHFAIDEKNNRLYVSAEEHHSIEVFDLKTGAHSQSASGVTTPHTLAFVAEKNELLVADGGDNSCRVLDITDMHQIKRIPLEGGPDAGLYDAEKRLFYVGNGGRGAKQPYSYISVISADEGREVNRIRVEAANLESMALDRADNLLYVNMRDKKQIGVVDLSKNEVRQTWDIPGLNLNTPMGFDALHHRLFIAGRKPGKLFVIDTHQGHVIQVLDCVDIADDMAFDPQQGRIYVTGFGGVSVFQQNGADDYKLLTQFDTNGGKTSAFDRDNHRLYIAHTKTAFDNAGLQIYSVN